MQVMTHFFIIKALFSNLEDYGEIINKTSAFDTQIKQRKAAKMFSILAIPISNEVAYQTKIDLKIFSCSRVSADNVNREMLKEQKLASHADFQ